MALELLGFVFSLYYRWFAALSLSANGIKWHQLLLALLFFFSHDPLLRVASRGLGRGGCSGFGWHARAELSTALLATSSHFSNLSQLGVVMVARCSPHTLYTHPLRAPPKLQHYPHLLHYYALLSPVLSLLVMSLPSLTRRLLFVCSFPEQKMGNPNSRRSYFV